MEINMTTKITTQDVKKELSDKERKVRDLRKVVKDLRRAEKLDKEIERLEREIARRTGIKKEVEEVEVEMEINVKKKKYLFIRRPGLMETSALTFCLVKNTCSYIGNKQIYYK